MNYNSHNTTQHMLKQMTDKNNNEKESQTLSISDTHV